MERQRIDPARRHSSTSSRLVNDDYRIPDVLISWRWRVVGLDVDLGLASSHLSEVVGRLQP